MLKRTLRRVTRVIGRAGRMVPGSAKPPDQRRRNENTLPEEMPAEEYQLELDPDKPVHKWRNGQERALLPRAHSGEGYPGVSLEVDEYILTPDLVIGPEHVLSLHIAADATGAGSLALACKLRAPAEDGWVDIATFRSPEAGKHQYIDLSLSAFAGTTARFRITRRPEGTGEIRLLLLRVSPRHRAGRVNALSAYAFRLRNEVSNFSGDAYRHGMYGEESRGNAGSGRIRWAEAGRTPVENPFVARMRSRIQTRLDTLEPAAGEVTFNFAMRALGMLLPMQPPNFFERVGRFSQAKPLRILSILSGAARIEEQILAHRRGAVQLTLLDATPDLMQRAADRLETAHPGTQIECLVGDINAGLPGSGQFDIILCVSALHHVANLEDVLGQVNERLDENGEFWSIGEQIGRNGNRLWPDAWRAANEAFAALPSRLRRNAHTGQIDDALSDRDFSIGCFEGIRSEELETMLEACLVPEHVYKRNAFLWRLVDITYGDNFRLTNADDLHHLKSLVAAEALHWATGGRSTELHGVYRKKFIVDS